MDLTSNPMRFLKISVEFRQGFHVFLKDCIRSFQNFKYLMRFWCAPGVVLVRNRRNPMELCGFQNEFDGLFGESLDFLLSSVACLLNSMDFRAILHFLRDTLGARQGSLLTHCGNQISHSNTLGVTM